MKPKLLRGLGLGLLLTAGNVLALSTDRDKPIEIEADAAEADDSRGVTIYTGDVIIIQGTLQINGDIVTIHFDDNQDITKVIAEGEPAKFRQQTDGETDYQNAHARTLEFHTNDDTIVLLGNAKSWQGNNRIEAEKIVYDTRLGKVKADSTATLAGDGEGDSEQTQGASRVKITIEPKKTTDSQ
ncbi:MAG: lipopolysaccharide transport periplasmic protein LptA [Thiotrichales bacterium]|nr:lipopolysaccharide transport periplasmic protein LptA [Thiotrichales bacterium]|tara:strand:- start:2313 stop:2864 length:552 start_codon:yes stop_codon:yes gene_type:complete